MSFRGYIIYAGTINRPLRLLTVCDNAADGLLIMLRSPTKLVANIPPGVGADSSRPYPDITKYTYPFQQICVFALSNMRFRSPFRGCIHIRGHDESAPTAADRLPKCPQRIANAWRIRICGHDKSAPYGCERIAKTLLTDCQNAHNRLPKHKQHKHKNTTIVHHPTVTYFIKHTYSLTLIHIIYNIMHIFNCLREHLDNTKTAETYLNINLLKICKRLIFFTL